MEGHLPFYSFTFVVLVAFAVFYYRVGESECGSGIVWALVSVLISVAILQLLHGGMVAIFLGQVALFVVITAYRVFRDRE